MVPRAPCGDRGTARAGRAAAAFADPRRGLRDRSQPRALRRIAPAEGVDPSASAVEFCRSRGLDGRPGQGELERLPFEDGRFGLIAATDVIEHVADDRLALAELHRVAGPAATLLLTVPAYRWMWSVEDERLGHHRRYTLGRLRDVCAESGWEPRFGTYFNLTLLPAIALARRLPGRDAERRDLERTPAA